MKLLVMNALSALYGGSQTYLINFLEHLPEGDLMYSISFLIAIIISSLLFFSILKSDLQSVSQKGN